MTIIIHPSIFYLFLLLSCFLRGLDPLPAVSVSSYLKNQKDSLVFCFTKHMNYLIVVFMYGNAFYHRYHKLQQIHLNLGLFIKACWLAAAMNS